MERDKRGEELEKLLGEPYGLELPENSLKVRRNLLGISTAASFLVLQGAKLKDETTIAGIQFTGLADSLLLKLLTVVIAYMLFEYIWHVMQHFVEWRLRLTGTRVQFVTTARLSGEGADYPNDPRQSTLYNWWVEAKKSANKGWPIVEKVEQAAAACMQMRDERRRWDPAEDEALRVSIQQLQAEVKGLREATNLATERVKSDRIESSLARFDAWFGFMHRAQNLRWLVLDVILPISVAGYALFLLVTSTRL